MASNKRNQVSIENANNKILSEWNDSEMNESQQLLIEVMFIIHHILFNNNTLSA